MQTIRLVAVSNHPFVPLRHREVRLLWGAAVVSDVGTWVQLIVVGSLVDAQSVDGQVLPLSDEPIRLRWSGSR